MDRKYSDPEIWHISIDHDDAPDGSDGGYGKHGAYIPPEAMKEIVASRKLLIEKDEVIQRLRWGRERYRQMAEHFFSPAETDPDTCRRCSLNFRDPVHTRQKALEGE